MPLTTTPQALTRNRNLCLFCRDRVRAEGGSDVRAAVAAEGPGWCSAPGTAFRPRAGCAGPWAGRHGESPVVSPSAFGRERLRSLPHGAGFPSKRRQGEAAAERPSDGGGSAQRRDRALLLARVRLAWRPRPRLNGAGTLQARPFLAAAHPLWHGVFRAGLDLSRPRLGHRGLRVTRNSLSWGKRPASDKFLCRIPPAQPDKPSARLGAQWGWWVCAVPAASVAAGGRAGARWPWLLLKPCSSSLQRGRTGRLPFLPTAGASPSPSLPALPAASQPARPTEPQCYCPDEQLLHSRALRSPRPGQHQEVWLLPVGHDHLRAAQQGSWESRWRGCSKAAVGKGWGRGCFVGGFP